MKEIWSPLVRRLITAALISGCLASAQEPNAPAYSWDLSVDANYAARTAKQLKILTLEGPKAFFLDNDKVAITYADGEGAPVGKGKILRPDSGDRSSESPLYKFHALILDGNKGPGTGSHLEWEAVREGAQFMPIPHGGFAVRVDNRLMVYSDDSRLVKRMDFEYRADKPLPIGENVVEEYYSAAVSATGSTVVVCHSLRGRHSGGDQVAWYDIKTLKQLAQSEMGTAAGCRLGFNVTDNAVYSGLYVARSGTPQWQIVDPRCINCTPMTYQPGQYSLFDLLNDKSVLIYGKDDQVFDLEGHLLYVTAHEKGVRVDKPDAWVSMPHAANAPRIAYDDGQPTQESGHRRSKRIHVVDWKDGREVAVIKVIQEPLPVLHDGGLQLSHPNLIDLFYALSPDGKKLAVLSMNSLNIYKLP
jgi:hypothetical protein